MATLYTRRLRILLLYGCLIIAGVGLRAEVNFSVAPVATDGETTREVARKIYEKTEQILTRNSAAAAGSEDVFTVKAYLSPGNRSESSGLVREITSISGEFTLVAMNKIDGAKYYSVTVPVKAALKSDSQDAMVALANSIRPTDAVYTRFVRVAREKVSQYYEEHCGEIINRARSLKASGLTIDAMVYLTGVPPSAPCYEDVISLLSDLRSTIDNPAENTSSSTDQDP